MVPTREMTEMKTYTAADLAAAEANVAQGVADIATARWSDALMAATQYKTAWEKKVVAIKAALATQE